MTDEEEFAAGSQLKWTREGNACSIAAGESARNLVAKLGATIANDLARRIGDRITGEGAITFDCSAS
jgi:hypothetical protein